MEPRDRPLTLDFLKQRQCPDSEIAEYYHNLENLRKRIHPKGPYAPVPKEEYLIAPDGVKIFVQSFIPSNPKLVMLCQHGNNVQSDLFFPLTDQLFPQNIAVILVDNRGHGRSGPNSGHLNKPDLMFPIYNQLFARFPQIPHFMIGESLGSVMTTGFSLSNYPQARTLQSIILLVPPYRIHMQRILDAVLPVVKLLLTIARIISLDFPFFHNRQDFRPSYFREYHKIDQKDPIRNPKTSALHFLTDINLMNNFSKWVPQIRNPAYILEGTADTLCHPYGAIEMAHLATKVHRKVHLYKGAEHSLMLDKNSQSIYSEIDAWLAGGYKSKKNK